MTAIILFILTGYNSVKCYVNPSHKDLLPFVQSLTQKNFFNDNGIVLHKGRNVIKKFHTPSGVLAVKSYRHLTFFNRLIYGFLRKSKAERANQYGLRINELGINTPTPVAFIDIRRHGLLQESFFVSFFSDYHPISSVTEHYTHTQHSASILDALSCFLLHIHDAGICHNDLNINNILYKGDEFRGYAFQVIDTNRMTFKRHLSIRQRINDLRRLSCPTPAYLYILEQYARRRNADTESVQLEGAIMRLMFEMRQRLKQWVKSALRNSRSRGIGYHKAL